MQNLKRLQQLYILKSIGVKYLDNLELIDDNIDVKHLPSDINKLEQIVLNCHLCQLSKSRKNVVFADGGINSDIMFVGEAPGMYEDELGLPFVGRAGELLTKMIENVLLIKREEVYIANIIKCRPPNNRVPSQEEVDCCKEYIIKQIDIVKPKIIVALGMTSYQHLLNDNTPISKARGHILNFNGIKLIPTYHPIYLLRNPSAKKDAFVDMKLVKRLLDDI
jgi:DNA polymerase